MNKELSEKRKKTKDLILRWSIFITLGVSLELFFLDTISQI